jgi:hypothetical protein
MDGAKGFNSTSARGMHRRGLLGAGSALLAGAGALVSVGPRAAANGTGDDVEILRLGAEWLPLQQRYCSLDAQCADMVHIPEVINRDSLHSCQSNMNSQRKSPNYKRSVWRL